MVGLRWKVLDLIFFCFFFLDADGLGQDVLDGDGPGGGAERAAGVAERHGGHFAALGAPPVHRHRAAARRGRPFGPGAARVSRPGPVPRTLQRGDHRPPRTGPPRK